MNDPFNASWYVDHVIKKSLDEMIEGLLVLLKDSALLVHNSTPECCKKVDSDEPL